MFGLTHLHSQILFNYDAGGNLIERKIQIINPGNSRFEKPENNSDTKNPKDSLLKFVIYPNPTNDFINIEGKLRDENSSCDILLRNGTGTLVREDIYMGKLKTIPVGDLASGIYFLEIKYDKKNSSTYKIIISN